MDVPRSPHVSWWPCGHLCILEKMSSGTDSRLILAEYGQPLRAIQLAWNPRPLAVEAAGPIGIMAKRLLVLLEAGWLPQDTWILDGLMVGVADRRRL